MTMNKFVIGDIHGAARAFEQVLERSGFDNSKDLLICLGDVYDGWPESAQAIEMLMKIKNLVLIIGNHDNWFLGNSFHYLNVDPQDFDSVNKKWSDDYHNSWLRQGGKKTLESYQNHTDPKAMRKHYNWFLKNYKVYYIDDNRLFLHAGYMTDYNLNDQPKQDSYYLPGPKNENPIYFWDRTLWLNSLIHYEEIEELKSTMYIDNVQGKEFNEIYVGHNPTILPPYSFKEYASESPINLGKLWNMDTGASYHGKLSMMNIDTKEIFQSDYVHSLYPGEFGRNHEILTHKK